METGKALKLVKWIQVSEGKAHAINSETKPMEANKELNSLNVSCPPQSLTQSLTLKLTSPSQMLRKLM